MYTSNMAACYDNDVIDCTSCRPIGGVVKGGAMEDTVWVVNTINILSQSWKV